MAFSTGYKAFRDALATTCETVFSVASTAVHFGSPGIDIDSNHVVLSVDNLESSYDHPAATGNRPGMTIEIQGEAFVTYPAANTVTDDAALVYADALAAAVEAASTFGGAMMPLLASFALGELTGIQEGNGDARLHLRFTVIGWVQRARG